MPYFTRVIKVDRVGFEPSTSALKSGLAMAYYINGRYNYYSVYSRIILIFTLIDDLTATIPPIPQYPFSIPFKPTRPLFLS
jgi:hypothetical protein